MKTDNFQGCGSTIQGQSVWDPVPSVSEVKWRIWMVEDDWERSDCGEYFFCQISYQMTPGVCPMTGSTTTPSCVQYLVMLKTDNVIAHAIKIESSTRMGPWKTPSTINYNTQDSQKIVPGQVLRHISIRGTNRRISHIPSSKPETSFAGVRFHRWTQKSFGIESHRVRINSGIVHHEPKNKK